MVNADTLAEAAAAMLSTEGGPSEEGAKLIRAGEDFATEGEAIATRVLDALRQMLPAPEDV